jgi:uncharacterized protein (TIGR02594 family)
MLPQWMEIAEAELAKRVRDYPGPKYEPRVAEYLATTGYEGNDDETSWCSAFVNWCITKAGFVGTNSAIARSWLQWGKEVGAPEPGCIAVLWRDHPQSWKGHVGFFAGFDGGYIRLLGGNQGGGVDWDEVCYQLFPPERLLGFRAPE